MEHQIIITIKTPITSEAHEKLEDKLKVLREKEGLESTIENTITGNSVSVGMDKWIKTECSIDERGHLFVKV